MGHIYTRRNVLVGMGGIALSTQLYRFVAGQTTKPSDDDRCKSHPEIWQTTLVEKTDTDGTVWKEGVWKVDADCDGGSGTLVKTMTVQFFKDKKATDASGHVLQHSLAATVNLWVKMSQVAQLSQSLQLFDARNKGLFALGPFQWHHDKVDTYQCAENSAYYPDDQYDNLDKCCRLPSVCQ